MVVWKRTLVLRGLFAVEYPDTLHFNLLQIQFDINSNYS